MIIALIILLVVGAVAFVRAGITGASPLGFITSLVQRPSE